MSSPLTFVDVFNQTHIEPSVTGFIKLEESEPIRPDPVSTLIVLSPFRSGKPLQLNPFHRAQDAADYHDPDRTGDQGVALIRAAKDGISEQDMFGAADLLTCRIDPAVPSSVPVNQGALLLGTILTTDYGSHTRRSHKRVDTSPQTIPGGLRLTLGDDNPQRQFQRDNLGPVLNLQYKGNASVAELSIRLEQAIISYSDNPADGDNLSVNGVVFEFDSDQVSNIAGSVNVEIDADPDVTFARLASKITENVPGVTAAGNATANTVTAMAPEDGVVVHIGVGLTFMVAGAGAPAHLTVALTNPQDGSTDLSIPLASQQYKSLGQLVAFINNQLGYSASVVPTANKALPSAGLDFVSAVDVTTVKTLTAYVACFEDFVNHGTRGNYQWVGSGAQGKPDLDLSAGNPIDVRFTGGVSPVLTITDWENALDAVGQGVDTGGILLPDTDDPAIMALVVAFIDEQTSAGKWFRAYFGAQPALDDATYEQIAGSLDHPNARLLIQRPGYFGPLGTIVYQPPIYAAAAVAGAAGGNRPYVNPLTNKRFRFAGIHPDDQYPLDRRESFLDGGISIFKNELGTNRLALCVTTSRDPDKRMARIASEIDTLKELDATIRERFREYRGKWVNNQLMGAVIAEMTAILDAYRELGALVDGVDDFGVDRKAWNLPDPAAEIQAGVLNIHYDVFIGGELNHISEVGNADYQRIRGSITTASQSTAVPIQ